MGIRAKGENLIFFRFSRVLNSGEPSSDRVFTPVPSLSFRTTPDNLIAVGSPPRGNLFRRNFPATFFSGKRPHIPNRRRLIYTPVETPPATGISRAPTRRPSPPACHPRAGAWLTFRPLPTPLQARPAPSWPSSPSAVLPEPCISIFFPVFGFLAIPATSDRAPPPSPRLGENYLSWSASVELWFMGQGYEDHLVTQEADILEVDRVQWRKIDAQLCSVLWQSVDPRILLHLQAYKTCFKFWTQAKGLYTNDIWRLYKVASAIVHLSQQDLDLSTYIGQIASLKEQFLTVMPLTPDVGAQQTQLDKFFMVLTLIGLRPDLEPIRDQILGSSSVPSLDDVFARLLLVPEVEANVLIAPIAINLATLAIVAISYMEDLLALPIWPSPLILRCLSLQAPPHLRHLRLLLPLLPSLDRSTGKTIGVGRESQGLYHLTSDSSPAVCISIDAPLLIHNRLGHPSLSKFQKMVPRFSTLSSLPCESCQLGKHTRVSFPKRLNNRAKSPFELVHTDVWGPCRIASTLGFQYFVTFIDDYSRSQFTSFMSHHGILHQSSCAHTPQQNGVAERKNRHLVETARQAFRQSHEVPLLGIFQTSEGLSLYSLETHRYFISADVTFFEDSPFFSTTSESLPVSEVLPIPIVSPPDAMPPRPLQGTRSTRNPHPIYNFLSYHRLSSPYSAFVSAISSVPLPKSTHEALSHPDWRQAMVDEMAALHSNSTWDLVVLPSGKSTVGCRWVYAVKVGPDGQVDRLKARLVAKGYTQVYGSDYGDTFSPIAKIASVRLLLSMAAMCSWPLYQLDIKNAFLHGDLAEEVYMEQPPGFVAQGESGLVCRLRRSLYGLKQSPRAWFSRFSSVVQEFGMLRSTADHSVFYHHNSLGQCIYLVVYVDDIVITAVIRMTTPMDPNVKLVPGQGEPLGDPGRYRRLVGKLNYLTITRPDISFPYTGQGVLYKNRGHTQVVGYTDADWAGSPTDRRSTSGYCVFIGGNLISWKSKKQDVVARSSAEAEYRAMALATCELIWLRHLLQELRFGKDEQMKLICDNQATLHIASNPVFHEKTKHIEVDCHFIREKIASGCVATSFVNSNDQLADIFTKSLRGPRIKYICNKLGAYDVYAPA
ncbi:Retrovirus-related Pol polyprotein from transposon TNT 1-94 [Vitis vinifera]|uniref:Retrovirus-related Pol polyprotein from transposon TNT 1-94 n=1 Tax=Vitis vinifera TaxID=29760 RepID=A0A438BRG6_VITVI|nr:Retrovirus-related Pol polyprotein from transposon TNT 1-94 [Vitis vinifera]